MKNKVIGILTLIAGALIAVGPQVLFKVCDTDGDMVMRCHYTGQAVLGIGIEIVILAIIQLWQKDKKVVYGLSIANALNGILTVAVTDVLIGVCNSEHMRCHSLTKPALNILGFLVIALAIVGIWTGSRGISSEKGADINE